MKEDFEIVLELLKDGRRIWISYIDRYPEGPVSEIGRIFLARVNAEIARRIPQTYYILGNRFHGFIIKD